MPKPDVRPSPAAISIRGWGWRHALRHAWALRELDLEIEPGERVLLLGASGSGKSTLMQAMAGVLGGDDEGEQEGQLLVDGRHPSHQRGRAGLVLQDPDSQVILSRVGDDVAFGCENLGVPRKEIWERVDESLDAVGLQVGRRHPTEQLSGGQKQRLALAGVLAMRPGLILLDEPTANVDPEGVVDVRDAVGRALDRTDATLVVIEHRVSVWLPIVDRVVVLTPGGGILADGPAETVLAEHGEALADAGVWVPGRPPVVPNRSPRLAEAEPVLSTSGLAVARRRGIAVRTGIELDVRAGEVLAVTGPNGAGKSTLALTLAGLLAPESGAVTASPALRNGADVAPADWSSRELLTRIGTVFQDPEHQFLASSVRTELEVGPRALGLDQDEIARRVDDVLDRLRLRHLERANPFTLSGGEKRRLSVATALVTRPRVLMLDEPTFGQDARTWAELVALLAELRDAGTSIIAVSHDTEFVETLADRTIVFDTTDEAIVSAGGGRRW